MATQGYQHEYHNYQNHQSPPGQAQSGGGGQQQQQSVPPSMQQQQHYAPYGMNVENYYQVSTYCRIQGNYHETRGTTVIKDQTTIMMVMVVASATTIRLFTKTTMPTIIKVIVTRPPPPPTRTPSCRRIVLIAFSSLDCRIQLTKKTLSAHSPQLARSKSPKVYMRPLVNSLSLILITRHAARLSLFGSKDQGAHWRCDDHVSIGRERTKSDRDFWRDGVRRTRNHSGENCHARTKEPICRDVGKLTQTINWHSLSHTHIQRRQSEANAYASSSYAYGNYSQMRGYQTKQHMGMGHYGAYSNGNRRYSQNGRNRHQYRSRGSGGRPHNGTRYTTVSHLPMLKWATFKKHTTK